MVFTNLNSQKINNQKAKVNYFAKNPIKTEQKRRRKLKYLKMASLPSLDSMIGNNLPPNGYNYPPYQLPI